MLLFYKNQNNYAAGYGKIYQLAAYNCMHIKMNSKKEIICCCSQNNIRSDVAYLQFSMNLYSYLNLKTARLSTPQCTAN